MSKEALKDLNKTRQEMFEQNQAALPEEDRAAVEEQLDCKAEHYGWFCTKVSDHKGDHVAHSSLGVILYRWKGEQS